MKLIHTILEIIISKGKIFLLGLLIILQTNLDAQIISGKIKNTNGELINNANIIAKDSTKSISIKAFTIANNGYYTLILPKATTAIMIEVKATNYIYSIQRFDKIDSTTAIYFDFVLEKDTVKYLESVTVNAKTKPYKIKGDTTNFKVSGYADGTEKKIQDIIKKLPGIELNEKTGEIKYKGKLIETITLDGDDLFGDNYTIGTKNINVDKVDVIQAIENYSKNPLLKGIENEDKVALNLTLKKNNLDFSGDLSIGVGSFSNELAHNTSLTLLGVSKKYKMFATSSYNNIGENNTPFDYYSNTKTVEQILNESLIAPRYLNEPFFNSSIDDKRQNINNNFWSSYNALHKLGVKGSIKTSLYYLSDKIKSEQLFQDNNIINGQSFVTSDEYFLTRNPNQYRGDMEMKFQTTSSSIIEYRVRYKKEKVLTSSQILQNNITNLNSILETNDNLFDQKCLYTNRISNRKALILIANYSSSEVPQSSTYNPAIIESLTFTTNTQFSSFQKNKANFQAILLGNGLKNSKYKSSVTADFQNVKYKSLLTGLHNNNSQNISGFINDINYKVSNINLDQQYVINKTKFKISMGLNLSYINQNINDTQIIAKIQRSNFLIQPLLNVSFKPGSFSKIIFSTAYKQRPFSETNFVTANVLLSNREIQQNIVSLDLQKTKSINISYTLLNLSKNFEISSNLFFANNKGNYFSKFVILQNKTIVTNFFLPESNNNFIGSFSISKYLPSLKGTLKFRGNLSKNWYKNILNNSTLRNNKTSILTTEIFYKTKIRRKIVLDNTIVNYIMQTKSENKFNVNNFAISNNFQFVYNIFDLGYFALTNDFYLPNIKQKKEFYLFFDVVANFKTKKKIYDFTLKLRNISNTKSILQFQTLDYATSIFKSNLLTRHFIFSVSRNF